MSMQSVASPVYSFTPPRRNSLTHIPGDEGWPLIGKTLEVLADPKLPKNGPGRAPGDGNFVLTEFQVLVQPVGSKDLPKKIDLTTPLADFSQENIHVSHATTPARPSRG